MKKDNLVGRHISLKEDYTSCGRLFKKGTPGMIVSFNSRRLAHYLTRITINRMLLSLRRSDFILHRKEIK